MERELYREDTVFLSTIVKQISFGLNEIKGFRLGLNPNKTDFQSILQF